MDMSANELLQARNHAGAKPVVARSCSVHPGLRAPGDAPLGCRNWSPAGRLLPVSGSPRAAVPNAILIALSLCSAGCGGLQPVTTTRLIPPPRDDTKGAYELVSATKSPEAPSKPAQPAPQPAQRISETRPPPATASKGAEKLVAPNVPAPVHASERITLPPGASAPKVPIAEDSVTVTDTPVQALVFRGPPPQAQPSRAMKVLAWFGLGLGGAALAVVARLYVIRRAKPVVLLSNAGKDELKMPPELLLKEPLNPPRETVLAEKP